MQLLYEPRTSSIYQIFKQMLQHRNNIVVAFIASISLLIFAGAGALSINSPKGMELDTGQDNNTTSNSSSSNNSSAEMATPDDNHDFQTNGTDTHEENEHNLNAQLHTDSSNSTQNNSSSNNVDISIKSDATDSGQSAVVQVNGQQVPNIDNGRTQRIKLNDGTDVRLKVRESSSDNNSNSVQISVSNNANEKGGE